MQNKSHNHVNKPRTFSKGRTRSELKITPIKRMLTKKGYKLVFRHGLKTIITKVVRMRYPRDMEHIGYNIRSDHDACTSNASGKERYWIIKSMHVGVELMYKHEWTIDRTSHSDSHPPLWMTTGRLVSEKSDKMTCRSEWMPRLEKFSEKSCQALSSRNWIWEGVGSEEKDAPERRGFRDGVDFRLGVIENVRYVCMKMHEHVVCNSKNIMGSAQSNPTNTQSFQQSKHTSKMHETVL